MFGWRHRLSAKISVSNWSAMAAKRPPRSRASVMTFVANARLSDFRVDRCTVDVDPRPTTGPRSYAACAFGCLADARLPGDAPPAELPVKTEKVPII